MIEGVLELTLGNLPASFVLSALAYAVHRHGRYPALAHLLWVVVLLKVMTPPLLVLPMPLGVAALSSASITATAVPGSAGAVAAPIEAGASFVAARGPTLLVLAWFIGSAIVVTASIRRIRGFGRLLAATSSRAPGAVEQLAANVGHELGMRSVPPVYVTRAHISPMTWWTRGRIRLVVPAALLQRSDRAELRWVLAHELAHVRRHDHLVRWLEWLASVVFWWHPLVWLARRTLRLDEEDACDALVLQHLEGAPRAYASVLLDTVEVLSQPHGRVPAMATGMDAARSLERRLRTIVSPTVRRPAPRPLIGGLAIVALMSLALGVGPAGPTDAARVASANLPTLADEPTDTAEPGTDAGGYAPVSATLPGATGSGATFEGTDGDDEYSGTADDESILGFAGADELNGAGGHDLIRGGAGADTIRGGAGRDELHGGAGADVIRGGAGRDTIEAGAGADTIYSWSDGTPDRIDCGDGQDRAVIDSTDTVRACEDVVVRDRS